MKKGTDMKNCSTCARFDQNATAAARTGVCLSAVSPNGDRVMGFFGSCDVHEEQSAEARDATDAGFAA